MCRSTLPHEELARRMVRAVDVRVAVHARPAEHPVALVHGDGVVVVDRRRMPRRDVAALAEHRHADGQHAIVRRPVRVVTRRAVLADGRVLPEHRPAHLRVAAGAALADRAADLQRLDVADRAVRVVARRAGHLAFAHGHVRDGALGLRHLQPMARGAQLRSRSSSTSWRLERRRACARCGTWCTRGSAPRACCLPTPRARRGCGRSGTSALTSAGFIALELQDLPLRLVVDVRLAGAVAALAALSRGRRARVLRLRVLRALEAGLLVGVAEHAGVAAGVARRGASACCGRPAGRAAGLAACGGGCGRRLCRRLALGGFCRESALEDCAATAAAHRQTTAQATVAC